MEKAQTHSNSVKSRESQIRSLLHSLDRPQLVKPAHQSTLIHYLLSWLTIKDGKFDIIFKQEPFPSLTKVILHPLRKKDVLLGVRVLPSGQTESENYKSLKIVAQCTDDGESYEVGILCSF